MKKWVVRAKKADFNEIAERFNISPITARLIRNRDIVGDEAINYYLNASLSDMHDPFLMKGVSEACEVLINAINNGKTIRVVGDYDIDGVCATTILVRALTAAGGKISYRLPHRIRDGYGINNNIINEASDDDIDMIITCDNGIAAFEEIELANRLGMSVIITDHHEIPFEVVGGKNQYKIPNAVCVINPHQEDDNYPYENICGAMVAYKLILALQDKLETCPFAKESYDKTDGLHKVDSELTDMLLDFAAFATIGDIMPLVDENRVAVKYGIESVKHTKNKGLSALIDATGIARNNLKPYHFGFVLGPCVNAVGRLYSADTALELFLTEDEEEATRLAKTLKDVNEERKNLENEKVEEALNLVETGSDGHDYNLDTVLLVYLGECHESLAGLIAGKIKEKYNKPTIVFTDCETGIKGSGRSIDSYDIFSELSKHKDLYQKFGGHPMACGLSMVKSNFEELRRILNEESALTEDDLVAKYYIDIDMPINYVSEELLSEMDMLAPFGQDNPSPLFAQKNLQIISRKKNPKGNLVTLAVKSPPHNDKPERVMYATMFGDADEILSRLEGKNTITMAYVPEYNDYFDRVQLSIKDFI
ncbi:MAG: single-stranded-DNA-specific exonuclease RecJ [Lachnospiraceae bacterium]|nr:single-stranded-DNA-specific exonuclease RecJ [Lachnospiraceae bacterium]